VRGKVDFFPKAQCKARFALPAKQIFPPFEKNDSQIQLMLATPSTEH
jgi:hypothetical protein